MLPETSTTRANVMPSATFVVRSGQRGPAPFAQQLYEETAESVAAQAAFRELRRMGSEPALAIEQGRPTKRDRRELDGARRADWDSRWSASIDPDDDT